jgi:hypothetical protein
MVMRIELTSLVKKVRDFYTTRCVEIPGAKARGTSKMLALAALEKEVERIFAVRREMAIKNAADDGTTFETISVD